MRLSDRPSRTHHTTIDILLKGVQQARSIIIRQLTRKLGPVSDRPIDRINTLSIVQLEDLGEALFDFDSIDDLDR